MDPDRWRQIEQLYHSALERPAAERVRFLEEACGADAELRREVESLLAAAGDAERYFTGAVRDAASQAAGAVSASQPESTSVLPTRKLGRYELLEQVGKGGMGVVYRASDPTIGRTVAIKTILFDEAERSSELRGRLLRESQAGGQLQHPNIVAVYDVSEQGNTAYVVMEFVAGRTLEKAMAGAPSPLPAGEALRIVEQCAGALDYAHGRGVVHRDIKPANIMLQADGAVKIADFGIARVAQLSGLTQSGMIVGSPHFMAPEQWKGEPASGRTDQYALAAVAYSLLTGHRPFESETMASLAAKALYEEPRAASAVNPSLGPAVNTTLGKALSKLPEGRYETCAQFAAALRAACEKPPAAPPAPLPASPKPRRSLWPVAAAAAGLALLGAGVWLYQRHSAAEIEMTYWTSIKDSKQGGLFHAYLERYPEGQFAGLAKAQLETLANQASRGADQPLAANRSPVSPRLGAKETVEKSRQNSVPPPVNPVQPPPAGDPYLEGEALLKSGDYAGAVPYFSRALAAKPEYRAYIGRAGAYQHLERLEEAIENYSQAIKLKPDSAIAFHERGVCLARLKQDDRAFADYNRALELGPAIALAWNGRGVIYLHRKEYQKAIADFTEAIRLRPTLAQAFKNRAAAEKALGDTAAANADLKQADQLKPE
jgi:serine/threonine protein kinase/Flp pilus assembly protein TadD